MAPLLEHLLLQTAPEWELLLQEEEAQWRNRRASRRGAKGKPVKPLYTTLDALNSLDYFGRKAELGKPIELSAGIRATFFEAGHILGSAGVLLELDDGERQRRVVFSGDLGYGGRPILRDPAPRPDADIVVMETTYGDRLHRGWKETWAELGEVRLRRQDPQGARDALEQACLLDAKLVVSRVNLSIACAALGDEEAARAALEQAEHLDPDHPLVLEQKRNLRSGSQP